jgi:tetratricopeptide (TPR) repeat protein
MSVALENLHKYDEALNYANKANEIINEKSPLILLNRANIFMKLNNLNKAKNDF